MTFTKFRAHLSKPGKVTLTSAKAFDEMKKILEEKKQKKIDIQQNVTFFNFF